MRIKPNANKSATPDIYPNEAHAKPTETSSLNCNDEELLPLSGNPVKKYVPPIQPVDERASDPTEAEDTEDDEEEYLDLDNMPKKRARPQEKRGIAARSTPRSHVSRAPRTIKVARKTSSQRKPESDTESDGYDYDFSTPQVCRFVDDYDHVESNKVYALLGPGLSKMQTPQTPMERLAAIRAVKSEVKYPAYNKYILQRKSALLKMREDKPVKFQGAKKCKQRVNDFVFD